MARKTNKQLEKELASNEKTVKYLHEQLDKAHAETRYQKQLNFSLNNIAAFFRKRTNYTTNMTDEMNAKITNLSYLNTYLQPAVISWQEDLKQYKNDYSNELHKTTLLEVRVNDFENTFTLANNIALSSRIK